MNLPHTKLIWNLMKYFIQSLKISRNFKKVKKKMEWSKNLKKLKDIPQLEHSQVAIKHM